MKNGTNSSHSSNHPGVKQLVRNGITYINSVPQTTATIFAFSYVFILLLCLQDLKTDHTAHSFTQLQLRTNIKYNNPKNRKEQIQQRKITNVVAHPCCRYPDEQLKTRIRDQEPGEAPGRWRLLTLSRTRQRHPHQYIILCTLCTAFVEELISNVGNQQQMCELAPAEQGSPYRNDDRLPCHLQDIQVLITVLQMCEGAPLLHRVLNIATTTCCLGIYKIFKC